jgi:transporter family protein
VRSERGRPQLLWLPAVLGTVVAWGVWGVVVRAALDGLDWRLVATLTLGGYALCLLLLWAVARPPLPPLDAPRLAGALSLGVLSQVGFFAFYRALEVGEASVVVPLSSLYPLVTLALAMLLLRERLTRLQALGVAMAVAAVLLLAMG